MNLRDYQFGGIESIRDALRDGFSRIVAQAPTGAGKTVIAAAIIRMARAKGKRVIFCVPALELIDQTVARLASNGIYDVGVIQGDHPMMNTSRPVQVCSIQTLGRRGLMALPPADIVILDEVHIQFKFYKTWMDAKSWVKVPFIGLSATPWAKGMAKLWQKLIIIRTVGELIEEGYLCDFRVFASSHPNLKGVRTVTTAYGQDYDNKQLGERMGTAKLVADVVSTWLEKAQGRPTLLFAVNRLHARALFDQFKHAGVRAEYVDAYSTRDERTRISTMFNAGLVDVVCNVGVLTTGVDWDVRCIQLVRPTKSEMLYVQMIGRGLRTAQGKDFCLILDHSSTTANLGFVTDIAHDELDDGKKVVSKASVPLPKECPQCHCLRPLKVLTCPSCGFTVDPKNKVEHAAGELYEVERKGKKKVPEPSMEDKEDFYRELVRYQQLKGYKDGWAANCYREKYHVWPANFFKQSPAPTISAGTHSWVKHRNIALAKARQKAST